MIVPGNARTKEHRKIDRRLNTVDVRELFDS